MSRARIRVNGVVGSNNDLPIATLVMLSNDGDGDEATYNWQILGAPPGSTDSLSSGTIANPTLTPKVEGSYLIQLVVDLGRPSQTTDQVTVGIRFLATRLREPADGESDPLDWSVAKYEQTKLLNRMYSDPGLLTGFANGSGFARGLIVKMVGKSVAKGGLPGQEFLPIFDLAVATSTTDCADTLFIVESAVDGTYLIGNNGLMRVRALGMYEGGSGGSPSVGDPVYLSDSSIPALAAGTHTRRIGTVIANSASFSTNSGAPWSFGGGDSLSLNSMAVTLTSTMTAAQLVAAILALGIVGLSAVAVENQVIVQSMSSIVIAGDSGTLATLGLTAGTIDPGTSEDWDLSFNGTTGF